VRASTFWKTVVADDSEFLDRLLAVFEATGVRFYVIGGQGVNACADPVVSLDLGLVVDLEDVEKAEAALARNFKLETFPNSIGVSGPGSRSACNCKRINAILAAVRDVLDHQLPVAEIRDVLQRKVWAASDPSRRTSKRPKDFADIARTLEVQPEFSEHVPVQIRERLG
jgi:hypothetical protein